LNRQNHVLQMTGVTKKFPGVTALEAVDFSTSRGEIVALIGENGAGKSTLMKILAGIHQPDSGTLEIHGKKVAVRSPRHAAELGIAIIHQELEVIDTLDIAGNVYLGREPTWAGPLRLIDRRRIYSDAEQCMQQLGLDLSPRTLLAKLSTAQQQLIEIARALSLNARILIMDEPTSSLTFGEAERLFDVIRGLRARGASIVYVSHRLDEINQIADRVVVLRDGRNVGSLNSGEITHDRMVRLMVGRDIEDYYAGHTQGEQSPCLVIEKLRTRRYPSHAVSLALRRGEILGLAGLVGAGRSELAEAIFGIEMPLSGTVSLDGMKLSLGSPQGAIHHGVYLVPEDRRHCGLVTEMSVRENVTLPSLAKHAPYGWINIASESRAAVNACEDLKIKTPSIETAASNLSGGNQQKIVLSKWLSLGPRAIIFDEPTRGIDVGAKAEIYHLMRQLARSGVAVLMISSDMEEILGNSDRVAVMHQGRLTGLLERAECSQEAIMRLAVA
jgi:ribose transport system ATP-binding protein